MFTAKSTDGCSCVSINRVEIEKRFPSICVSIAITNQGFSAYLPNLWIEWDNIKGFIKESKDLAYRENFSYLLESMSPGEMNIKIKQINPEFFSFQYKLSKISMEHEPIQLKGSFDLGMGKLVELRTALLDIEVEFNALN